MGCCISAPTEQTTVHTPTVPTSISSPTEIQQSLAILSSQKIFIGNVDPKIQRQHEQRQQEQEQKTSSKQEVEPQKEQTYDMNIEQDREQQKKSLYKIWNKYATNQAKTKMNMESLIRALVEFGIEINDDRNLQKLVFNAFDSEQNGEWIDYDDFVATISFIITSNAEENLLLLFQIFDKNQNGFLEVSDVGRIIFSMHCINAMTIRSESVHCLSHEQILQISWSLVQKHIKTGYSPNSPYSSNSPLNIPSSSFTPNSSNSPYSNVSTPKLDKTVNIKISFEQFKNMMMDETKNDMIQQHKG